MYAGRGDTSDGGVQHTRNSSRSVGARGRSSASTCQSARGAMTIQAEGVRYADECHLGNVDSWEHGL
jgi:hypothetical protein